MMDGKKLRILIVEDEKTLSSALKKALITEGYIVEVASDGQIAVQKIQNSTYDLILLDMYLPKVEGLEFLKQKNILENTTPTIVLSNINEGEEMAMARELGAERYLIKADTSIDELLKIIKNRLSV